MNLFQRLVAFLASIFPEPTHGAINGGMIKRRLDAAARPTQPPPAPKAIKVGSEPIFAILGTDPIGSGVVRGWCMRAVLAGVNAEKVARANAIADRMDRLDPEAVFTLRGQDQLAAQTLSTWIERAKRRGEPAEGIQMAEVTLDAMLRWPNRKLPD